MKPDATCETCEEYKTPAEAIEKLLKRMRNEADTQTQSFHTYLVEQLLSVASSILAATNNQQNTVNSLSSKVDKSVSNHLLEISHKILNHKVSYVTFNIVIAIYCI